MKSVYAFVFGLALAVPLNTHADIGLGGHEPIRSRPVAPACSAEAQKAGWRDVKEEAVGAGFIKICQDGEPIFADKDGKNNTGNQIYGVSSCYRCQPIYKGLYPEKTKLPVVQDSAADAPSALDVEAGR